MSYVIENNVIKTQDIDFDFSDLGGLGYILFSSMKKYGQRVAQIDPESNRSDTYGHILRHAIRTAMVMKDKGIRKGDIVMGCSNNHLDACIPIISALFLGAIPCSMDPKLTYSEMTHLINQTRPQMIFVITSCVESIENICRDLHLNSEIVVFGASEKFTEFQSFTERQLGEDEFEPFLSHDPKKTAVIYFSSGSSGVAKACCLSHAYFIKQSNLVPTNTSVENLDLDRKSFEWSRIKCGGALLCYYPLSWIAEGKALLESIFIGGTRVVCTQFDPKKFWYLVEKHRILLALLSPLHISELVNHGKPPNVTMDSLIKILTGGSALPRKHWSLLQDMLPDADIVQCYGMTETGVITNFEIYNIAHREYYKNHPECVGFPSRGIWYKVVDTATGKVLGPNQEGELFIRSEFFMNGFYSGSTKDLFDSEGWFRTGDVVYYTDNCAFYIVDSLNEPIKYKNFTISPYILEKELLKHPKVVQTAVGGMPHGEDGERPAALVVLSENYKNLNVEEIRHFVDEKVQDKAKLRGGVKIVQSLPLTSSGKVNRRELRKVLAEDNNKIYTK